MTMFKKLLASTAALALTGAAFAQSAAIDVNGDGMYSFPELQAAAPELTEEDFGRLDSNDDGLLDAEEIAAGEAAGVLPR